MCTTPLGHLLSYIRILPRVDVTYIRADLRFGSLFQTVMPNALSKTPSRPAGLLQSP